MATILVYNIYVRLPLVEKGAQPLYISRLLADFIAFGIGIADLSGRVEFGYINLKTAYKVIEAEVRTSVCVKTLNQRKSTYLTLVLSSL